jgi:cysteine desulfurase
MAGPIDLDQQATTPLAAPALAAMLPFLEGQHWNPHGSHRGARIARAALEAARSEIAAVLGAAAESILFTSGATEANNLALKGWLLPRPRDRRRLVTFSTEHSSMLETARHLERMRVPLTIVPVAHDGLPDLSAFRAALGPDVALVSAMRVNNEIGAIWPTAELCRMAHAAGALFHSDAAQGFGKDDCRLDAGLDGADLVSISAHKIHGPKGIGALFVRPGISLEPQMDGGGQERGFRSGTQSPALAAGFGAAARLARERMADDAAHCADLMAIALRALRGVAFQVNGPPPGSRDRLASNLSLTFPGVDSARLMAALPGIAFSTGAACRSGPPDPGRFPEAGRDSGGERGSAGGNAAARSRAGARPAARRGVRGRHGLFDLPCPAGAGGLGEISAARPARGGHARFRRRCRADLAAFVPAVARWRGGATDGAAPARPHRHARLSGRLRRGPGLF